MRTLRVLAILTKRQMIDNAAYLVPAVVFSLVFVPAVIVAVLTDELASPSAYAIAVFVTLPILICLGPCILGIAQVRTDQISGVSALLSTLPVRRSEVLCARLVVGICIILIALTPLAIACTILWQVIGPPAWLVRDWRVDVFSGMSLVALTCYYLGLSAGARASTSWRASAAAPLAVLLPLLIVARGFGWPLLSVLLVILVALILRSPRLRLPSWAATTAVGVLTVIFVSLALFYGRLLSGAALGTSRLDGVEIYPRDLLARQGSPADVSSGFAIHVYWQQGKGRLFDHLRRRRGVLGTLCSPWWGSEQLLRRVGIVEFLSSRKRGNYYVNDVGRDGFDFAHLDCVDGRLVYRHNDARSDSSTFPWDWGRAEVQYVGPEGVSKVPAETLGRFGAALIGASSFLEDQGLWLRRHDLTTFTLLETQSRRFFGIDLENRVVSKGPELGPWSDELVQVGTAPDREMCRVDLSVPRGEGDTKVVDFAENPYVPVVCESGQIKLLDRDRLEVVGTAGVLPRPRTLFGRGSPKPHELLATDIVLVAVGARAGTLRWIDVDEASTSVR